MPQFRISIIVKKNSENVEDTELGSVIITVPPETWKDQQVEVVADMYKVASEYMDKLVACEITPMQ
jgi:hypothetical protein